MAIGTNLKTNFILAKIYSPDIIWIESIKLAINKRHY